MPSKLLELPRELRDEIYSYLYPDRGDYCNLYIVGNTATRYSLADFHVQGKTGSDLAAWIDAMNYSTALLRACKQLRREAMPVFENSIVYHICVEGPSIGMIGSSLSETAFRTLAAKMRRVTLTQQIGGCTPYQQVQFKPVDLSSLKRNTAILVRILVDEANEKLKVLRIAFHFHVRFCEGRVVVADDAVGELRALGRRPGVKVYNKSKPPEAVTEGCMRSLVRALGGVDCTEPEVS